MRTWTPEQRARQAEACRCHKPSRHATGPKTAGGKAKSRLNALKHGRRSAETRARLKMLQDALRAQCRYLDHVRFVIKLQNALLKHRKLEQSRQKSPIPANELITPPLPTPSLRGGPWADEAIQKATQKITGEEKLDCFVALLLAMTKEVCLPRASGDIRQRKRTPPAFTKRKTPSVITAPSPASYRWPRYGPPGGRDRRRVFPCPQAGAARAPQPRHARLCSSCAGP